MNDPIALDLEEFKGTRDMRLAVEIKADVGYVWMLPINPVSKVTLSATVAADELRSWCVAVIKRIDKDGGRK